MAAYSEAKNLYGVEIDTESFEDLAIAAWELIGNKHTRLYKYTSATDNKELKLPCNVDIIESVHIPGVDAQLTSNQIDFVNMDAVFVENYIDLWEHGESPFNGKGKYVKYKEGNNTLYFTKDYKNVTVVYHGIIVDDESGLPLVNEKELKAIAAFVAYSELLKESIRKRDRNVFAFAQQIQTDWLKRCSSARVVEHLTQNDMNDILDVKYRWDRKQYKKSLEPIL